MRFATVQATMESESGELFLLCTPVEARQLIAGMKLLAAQKGIGSKQAKKLSEWMNQNLPVY